MNTIGYQIRTVRQAGLSDLEERLSVKFLKAIKAASLAFSIAKKKVMSGMEADCMGSTDMGIVNDF